MPTEIRTALEGLPFPVRAQFRAVKPSSSLYRTARGLDTLSAVGVDRMIELAQSSVRKLDNAARDGEAFERAFIRKAFDDAPFAIRGNEVRGFENRPVEAILELQRRFTKTGARDTVVRAMVVPGVGPIDFVWGASEREQLVMNGRRHRGHGLMHVWGDHPSQFHAERLVRRLRESGIVMDETAKGQSRRIVLRHGSNSFFVLSEDETVGRMFLLTSFRTNKDVQRAQGPTEPQSFTVGSSASQRVVEGRPGLAGGEIRQPPQSASAARGEANATPAPAPPPRQRARKLVRPPEATPDGFDHAGNPDAARRALDDPGAPPPPPPTDPDAGTAAGPEVEGVPFARRSQNPDDDVERGPQQLVPGVVPRPTTRAGSREPQQFRSRQRVFGEPIGRFRPALDWRAELRRRINERRRAEGRPDLLEPETDVPLYLPENPLFAGFYVAPETRAQLLERKWVDRFNGVKRTQQQVVEQGGVVTDESDAYNEEQLHSGRVGQRLAELDATFMRPLAEEMQALGVSLEQVGEWAWALHAEERNEYLRTQRDPTLRAGSGMTTAQARQILRDAERDNTQALAVARRLLRRLREWVLDVQVEGGLLSEAQRDALKAQYADYVPLRTLDDGTGALQPGQRLGDPPIGVGGREFRRAEGRRSAPFNPVTALFAQASEAVHRAERNKVLMSFAAFFTDNPDPLLWRVERPVQLGDDGQPRWAPLDDQPQDQLLVRFKQNGEPRHIRVNDPTLAAAMRNLRHRELHRVIQWLSIINRTMSGLATRWNPAFIAPNLVRDVQTAAINAGIDVDAEVAVAILRDTPKAVRSVWSALRSPEKASGKFVDRFIEMRAAGGLTGWKSAHDFESTAKRLAAEWNTQHRTVIGQARRLARGVGDLMNDLGDATENGSRLAFYSAMRDRGLSVKQAAAAAKNLTVNFNKRGEYADVANAFLLFFNAGIQGSHRTLQSANTRRGRKLIGAMLAADVLLVGLLRGLAPEDEDGRNAYDYVTPWEKDGNLVGILPDGTRLKLPIPYGYSVIHALANAIVETTAGSETPLGAAARVVGSLSQSFNPTGAVGLKGTIPSQLRPFYELAVNQDYAGRPIYKDAPTFLGYDTPNSTRYFSGVTPASRVVTEWLNEVTGGNEVRSGWIDLNPEIIDHLIRSYGSGLGATLSQSFALPPRVLDALTGRQVLDVNEVPVFRRFYGQPWPNRFESRFFGDSGELALVEAEARLFLARGEELPERLTPELLRASAAWAGYREAIDEMDLQAAATIDEATPDERRRAAEERQALLVEALRLYEDAREGREGVMDLLLEQPAGVRGFTAALRRQQRPKDPAER